MLKAIKAPKIKFITFWKFQLLIVLPIIKLLDKINPKKIQEFDVVILVTDHDKFNYKILRKYSNLLVDTRGMIKKDYSNVISL